MTPKEIKQMNSYLGRPDTKTPEQRAKINKQNNLKEKSGCWKSGRATE